MPGVDGVLTVPYLREVCLVASMVALVSVVVLARELPHRDHPDRIAAGVIGLVATLVAGVGWIAPRWGQPTYDADATWQALENRYGITLSPADREGTDLGSYPTGRRSRLTQEPLTAVRDGSGIVRDDLFLQVRSTEPIRLAVVTEPDGPESLVPGYWWPELPVVERADRPS
ncbi:hypothetical protein ACWFNE_16950 [Cellulomonas sp. NPDC055163]